MADNGLFVHIAEAARMLETTQPTVRLLIKSGLLPVEDKIDSKRTYIPASAVKAYKKRIENMGDAS